MSFVKKHKYPLLVFSVILAVWGFSSLAGNSFGFFNRAEDIVSYVRDFGILGPVVIVGIIITEVLLAPVPGYFVTIASGIIYGPIWGSIYAIFGNVVGSSLAFYIARVYGKEVAARFVAQNKLDEYERQVENYRYWLWVPYFFPVFPVDILSFVFGLSRVSYRRFLAVTASGFSFTIFVLNTIAHTTFSYLVLQ